jgi:hypothetical protein
LFWDELEPEKTVHWLGNRHNWLASRYAAKQTRLRPALARASGHSLFDSSAL